MSHGMQVIKWESQGVSVDQEQWFCLFLIVPLRRSLCKWISVPAITELLLSPPSPSEIESRACVE